MIDYQATNIVNAALNLDLRSAAGLEKFRKIVQSALEEAAQQRRALDAAHWTCKNCQYVNSYVPMACTSCNAPRQ